MAALEGDLMAGMLPKTDSEGYVEFIEVALAEGAYPMHAMVGSACDEDPGDFMGIAILGWLDDDEAREAVKLYHEVADALEWLDDEDDEDDEPGVRPTLDDVVRIWHIERDWIDPLKGGGWVQGGGESAVPATLVSFAWL